MSLYFSSSCFKPGNEQFLKVTTLYNNPYPCLHCCRFGWTYIKCQPIKTAYFKDENETVFNPKECNYRLFIIIGTQRKLSSQMHLKLQYVDRQYLFLYANYKERYNFLSNEFFVQKRVIIGATTNKHRKKSFLRGQLLLFLFWTFQFFKYLS